MIIEKLKAKIINKKIKIAYPEADDIRVLKAAVAGYHQHLFIPLLLGKKEVITKLAQEHHLDIAGLEIIDESNNPYFDRCLELMITARQGKNTPEECKAMLSGRNYLATLLVYAGIADAALGGATYSTADTIRPALQVIKTKPGIKSVSSSFIMIPNDSNKNTIVMGDCAVIATPTAEALADIAMATAATAKVFGIEPKVAMLSFSTKGSAKTTETEKVINACQILKERQVDFLFDGELQFDAAFSPVVGQKKAPNSQVAGNANTFIFPSLEAGNIGYKIAQYLGDYQALGPILQGLNAPINDLSRGCNEEEVLNMSIITVAQALK